MNTVPEFLQALFQKMAWAVPAAPAPVQRQVRVESTTPRKLVLVSAPYTPGRSEAPNRKARRAARRGDSGQHPKPLTVRKHAQHVHPHDADGRAFTLVGKGPTRRVWLGGISAQRGY